MEESEPRSEVNESRQTSTDGYPRYRSHFIPRTFNGRLAVTCFVLGFLLAEPPILYRWANRIEPWLFGMPFLYSYLLMVYGALVGLLLWIHGRRL